MPVDTFLQGALFRFTVIKHHQNNPSDAWANTYEFQALAAGTGPQLGLAAGRLANFEEDFHFESTVFDRIVIATWEPDSAPYDPLNFFVYPLGVSGGVTAAADAISLTQCLHVTRNASYGRSGHLFYRNCLTEGDVGAPSGISVLVNLPAKNAALGASETSSSLTEHLVGGEEDLQMCLIDAAGLVVRPVVSLIVAGVSQVKTDHKWYNRTGSP